MRPHHLLALLPAAALIGAPFVANRSTPLILGLPFLLAWTVGAVLLTAGTMALIYRLDRGAPETERDSDPGTETDA